MSDFSDAVRSFRRVQDEHSDVGAADSEPSWIFTGIVEALASGDDVTIPSTAEGWDLFAEMRNSGRAAIALHDAAEVVVLAGRMSPGDARKWLGR